MKKMMMTTWMFMLLVSVPGLAQNPSLVKDINPSTSETVFMMSSCATLDGIIYFDGNDGTTAKLWRTDGTSAGTWMVKDVLPQWLTPQNGTLYFGADGCPWVSDGTMQGTIQLAAMTVNPKFYFHGVEDFTAMGSNVYYTYWTWRKRDNETECQLWKTDGTVTGTMYTGISMPSMYDYITLSGKMLMEAADGHDNQGSGREPWITDATSQGTYLLRNICADDGVGHPCEQTYTAQTVPQDVYNNPFHQKAVVNAVNGHWYFARGDEIHGQELWRTDGTVNGTIRIVDISSGTASSYPQFLVVMNGELYFTADDGIHGMELWRYSLPNGPAILVKDIAVGSTPSEPLWLTAMNGVLYFSAWTGSNGRELWKSDGTAAGTVLVADIIAGSSGSNPHYDRLREATTYSYGRQFTVLGDKLYFAADDGNGYELWESDGTAAGTVKTADINPNTGEGSTPRYLTAVGSRLFFSAYHPSYGNEWWVYETGSNQPPTASASATPTSGDAPLAVSFSSAGSNDPDGTIIGYDWDFGDGNTSTLANPSHTYQNPDTYTVTLTVTDNDLATSTDNVTITVTSSTISYVHVESQIVASVLGGGGKTTGQDLVLIHDAGDQPVAGAVVFATYDGPTSGTLSGTTGATGEVTLISSWARNPSVEWCFEVTNVVASGYTFDATTGTPGRTCESTSPKKQTMFPASCVLHQNSPNPFSRETTIRFTLKKESSATLRVFDLLGRSVAVIVDGLYPAGMHAVTFRPRNLPAGAYICRLESDGHTDIRLMQHAP